MEPSGAGDRPFAVPVWRRPWVVASAALVVTGGWVGLLPSVPAPRARVAWLGADEAAPRLSALHDRCDPKPLGFKRRVAVGSGPELECPEFTGVIRVPDDLAKGILVELRQDQDDRWWVRNRSADHPAEALFDADGKPLEFVTRVNLVPERWDLLISGPPRLALLGRFAAGFEAPPAEEEITGAVGLSFSTTARIDDPAFLDPSKQSGASPTFAYQALVANVAEHAWHVADHAWYKYKVWGPRASHAVVRIRAEADGATRQLPDVTITSRPEGLRFGSEFRLEQDGKGALTIVDVGANVHATPEHLFQYGVMGELFSRNVFGVAKPRVALLNIGEEEEKGNKLVKGTRDLFAAAPFNFVGNVEGNDLLTGKADVVVCEGFVGNVVLKVFEGVGHYFYEAVKVQLADPVAQKAPLGQAIGTIIKKLDYAEYGGAPLLGVDGLVMIMHGRSDRRAMANALKVSRQFVRADVNRQIGDALQMGETPEGASGGVGAGS